GRRPPAGRPGTLATPARSLRGVGGGSELRLGRGSVLRELLVEVLEEPERGCDARPHVQVDLLVGRALLVVDGVLGVDERLTVVHLDVALGPDLLAVPGVHELEQAASLGLGNPAHPAAAHLEELAVLTGVPELEQVVDPEAAEVTVLVATVADLGLVEEPREALARDGLEPGSCS